MSKEQQPIEENQNKKDAAKRLGRNIFQNKYNKNESCPLCLCEMKNKKVQHTLCGHTFHNSCLEQQFKSNFNNSHKCALCRVKISDKNTYSVIYTSPSPPTFRIDNIYIDNIYMNSHHIISEPEISPIRMRMISRILNRL